MRICLSVSTGCAKMRRQPGILKPDCSFASELKKLAADDNHWCQGKGKKALTLPPYWRVTVSVNDHPDYLQAIPANDETLKDKMLILKVYPDATVKLVDKLGGKKAFADKIREELPAYLNWLLDELEFLVSDPAKKL